MANYVIHNATIINEGVSQLGSVFTKDGLIEKVMFGSVSESDLKGYEVVDGAGKWLLPGVIDDQVHFRDPGVTYKGDVASESKAAVAGGVTTYMEMPNTKPQTTTIERLEDKFTHAAEVSSANYSFYMGATNDNVDEIIKVNPKTVCGIKVFMGSSTGKMLVDKKETLDAIFSNAPVLVATHCEDEETIRENTKIYRENFGDEVPMVYHPKIRSAEACYLSSSFAVELAKKHGTRLHILHLSTEKETHLFEDIALSKDKKITAEVCVHHLTFTDKDYLDKKALIKWNPAVKTEEDKEGLWKALLDDRIDVIATDHAPHIIEEKDGGALKAMSGGPMVQHSLNLMLEFSKEGRISKELVVEKMCHAPAKLFDVEKRGYIREGYFADLVLVNPELEWTVTKENLFYKCKWSPIEGKVFSNKVEKTFVNGEMVFADDKVNPEVRGQRITFDR